MIRSCVLLISIFLSSALAANINHPSQKSHLPFLTTQSRSLVGEDCHCDGSVAHCTSGLTDESLCHCENNEVHCDVWPEDCHCDGDDVHCDGTNEDACTCADREVTCDSALLAAFAAEEDDGKPWGAAIGATLVVNLATLIGVVFAAGDFMRRLVCPGWETGSETQKQWTHNYIPMFACGALLATTFFLVLPEALYLIQDSVAEEEGDGHAAHRLLQDEHEGESKESAATWRWGSSILGGFLIPVIVHYFFPHDRDDEAVDHYKVVDNQRGEVFAPIHEEESKPTGSTDTPSDSHSIEEIQVETQEAEIDDSEDKEEGKKHNDESEATEEIPAAGMKEGEGPKPRINWSLFMSLSAGDFFHNFADGVFIGTAFLLCERDIAVTVAVATIAHELPQEIADYFLLVHQCHFTPMAALLANFLVGFSVMLGAILVLAVPDIGNGAIGVILAVSGGVYIHVAVCECYVRAEKFQITTKHKLGGLLGFVIGCVPIGLVLINHEHCGGHDH